MTPQELQEIRERVAADDIEWEEFNSRVYAGIQEIAACPEYWKAELLIQMRRDRATLLAALDASQAELRRVRAALRRHAIRESDAPGRINCSECWGSWPIDSKELHRRGDGSTCPAKED